MSVLVRRFFAAMLIVTALAAYGCATAPARKDAPKDVPKDAKKSEASNKFSQGLMAMQHGNLNKAESRFLDALKLEPESYNTRVYLARVYTRKKENLKAVEQYNEAVKLLPKKPAAYVELMGVYFDMLLPSAVAETGEKALLNGVPEAAVSTDLGWAYYQMGDLDNAEKRLRRAKKLSGKDATPLNDLGLVLFSKGKYAEAASEFKEADKKNPKSVLSPYLTAVALNKLGKQDEALEALSEGVKRDPKLPSKAELYNKSYFFHGDPGDMSGLFEKLKANK